ncbi:MAG: molybdopterin-dependent oxidoreductase [Acidimicrobiales bacterium]|nr:molybdopterin-dependent oxidoreductase [Acidimicrobiales bacterium]MCB9395786.1 molybdopterin-dependent oxidoreductase [Acidimicrobiaceae bacterium]
MTDHLDVRPIERLEIDAAAPSDDRPRAPRWAGPVAGLVAGAAAIGTGSLVAALADVDSPTNAVGSEFIDHTPAWLKRAAIDWFGTADKTALRAGIFTVIALLAAAAGALARRRPPVGPVIGPAIMVVFGLVGGIVAAGRPGQSWVAAVPALCGALVGSAVIVVLAARIRSGDGPRSSPGVPDRAANGYDRRWFVGASGGVVGASVVAAAAARRLESQRLDRLAADAPDELPAVDDPTVIGGTVIESAAPVVPDEATLSPLTPYLTPNDRFYLIDTALSVPRVRLDRWAVEIGGRVDRPLRLTYDDLLARPQVERIITLACVSNEVGGNLIGNATWQGVLLRDLLDEAGVRPDAEQVFGTSVDGWTCGFPVQAALDGRDAMIAIGMNGEPLPLQHGFPARMVVPGLYGYVSATKWLQRIDLTTWDEAEGYWVPRGWARDAPIKTQSRIDVPRSGEVVPRGVFPIAGIAWAQHRGVERVEVRVDRGPWQEARLAPDLTIDSWRQWVYEWDTTGLAPGDHTIQVRATDATGATQTEQVSRPDPDGATGWHTRTVTVVG